MTDVAFPCQIFAYGMKPLLARESRRAACLYAAAVSGTIASWPAAARRPSALPAARSLRALCQHSMQRPSVFFSALLSGLACCPSPYEQAQAPLQTALACRAWSYKWCSMLRRTLARQAFLGGLQANACM